LFNAAELGAREKIVPVEIVEGRAASMGSMPAGSLEWNGQFRVMLIDGVRIEVEAGFDAAELGRLIAALASVQLRNCLRQSRSWSLLKFPVIAIRINDIRGVLLV
jgi:hypothetical protein